MPIKKIPTSIKTHSMYRRLNQIPVNGNGIIEDFGLFLDTHRDLPHIGTFHPDLHRGQCRPIMVNYDVPNATLIEPTTGQAIVLHQKHMFLSPEWFSNLLLQRMMAGEGDPRDGDGIMPTKLLRDSRARVYHLWTFRQAAMAQWNAHKAAGTLKK